MAKITATTSTTKKAPFTNKGKEGFRDLIMIC